MKHIKRLDKEFEFQCHFGARKCWKGCGCGACTKYQAVKDAIQSSHPKEATQSIAQLSDYCKQRNKRISTKSSMGQTVLNGFMGWEQ